MSTLDQAKVVYFEKEDILYIVISEGPQCGSLELNPNITAELTERRMGGTGLEPVTSCMSSKRSSHLS